MKISPLDEADVHYVVSHMREIDREEIFATQWGHDLRRITRACMQASENSWVFSHGRPIAVAGGAEMHPGCWQVFMLATDDFRQISTGLTKFLKRAMIPRLTQVGARRAQCLSMAGHTEAHQWLELLGFKRTAVLEQYGREGQDFYLFSWRRGSDVYS